MVKILVSFNSIKIIVGIVLLLLTPHAFSQYIADSTIKNLCDYDLVPFPVASNIRKSKIKEMRFQLVDEIQFKKIISDSIRSMDTKKGEIIYSLKFNPDGTLSSRKTELLGLAEYKFQYNSKKQLISIETYRDGQKTAQNNIQFKYDSNGYILQVKSTWKEYYTGVLDQIGIEEYEWNSNHKLLKVKSKFPIERGRATKGDVKEYWYYKFDSLGRDTALTNIRYNENKNKWDTIVEHSKWKYESTQNILTRNRVNHRDHELQTRKYNKYGWLIEYTREGYYYGLNQNNKRLFYYNRDGELIAFYQGNYKLYLIPQYIYYP